jgi:phosphatidylglycerol lysyltransferase
VWKVLLSFFFTLLSYFFLVLYDVLGVRYIGKKLAFRKCAAVSFTASTFGNNLGLSILSSSAVRLRLYSLWNFAASDIGSIIIFCNAAEAAGFAALSVILLNLTLWPAAYHPFIKYSCFAAGLILAAALAVYLMWSTFSKKVFSAFGVSYKPAGFFMAAGQTLVSAADWIFAAAALYILLPEGSTGFGLFLASYLASEMLGMISNVPGGFGVFDAAAISLLSTNGAAGGCISAVILFRLIYYIFPLAVSYLVYGLAEAESARSNIFIKAGEIKDLLSSTPGYLFSFFAFLTGSAAILISSIPALQPRLAIIAGIVPSFMPLASSILCALCGAGLIIMTGGLQKNIYNSYLVSLVLLVAVSLLLLTPGMSYEAAFVIFAVFIAMLFFRKNFYRKTSPFNEKPTPGLLLSAAGVIFICAVFVYMTGSGKNTAALNGVYPLAFAAAALLIWMLAYIFIPYKPMPHEASKYDIDTAAKIAFNDPDTIAQLAMFGDKKLIFSWSRGSFLMYAQCGSHFVALGDPVGPYAEMQELIWKFKNLARHNNGIPVFFNTTGGNLHFYDNMGFNFYKIGEDAKVAIEYYPVDKKKDENLKASALRLEEQGYSFKMMPRNAPPSFYKDASGVSAEWLRTRKLKEAGFIIGHYDQEYLKNFHIAAVYKNGQLVLFADILSSVERDEFRIDMLRCAKGIDEDIEKYLKYKLVLWGKEKHYAFFNLGLAPLSGAGINTYTPPWNMAGAALYNYGSRFVNAWTLRKEREIFSPSWHPRYIICDNFMQVPSIFSEISLLTSGYKEATS